MLLSKEPSELLATSTWLFAGSTASAKIAERPWWGSGFNATQVEGAGAAKAPIVANVKAHSATSVAAIGRAHPARACAP